MASRQGHPGRSSRHPRHRRLSGDHADSTESPPTRPLVASTRVSRRRRRKFWSELPGLAFVAIVLTILIQAFVARIFVIPSASMEQTLRGCAGCTNDRVIVDKVTYRFTEPGPGDVLVFKGPPAWRADDEDPLHEKPSSGNPLVRAFQNVMAVLGASSNETDFVKRVIAVGGQTIACCDNQNRVQVDGRPVTEPYLSWQPGRGPTQKEFPPVRVPDGQMWVMGDNRNNSTDSRVHGPVPISNIIGKVRAVILPISRWRTVRTLDAQAMPLGQSPPSRNSRVGLQDDAGPAPPPGR